MVDEVTAAGGRVVGRRAIEYWVVAIMRVVLMVMVYFTAKERNRCCCLHPREGAAMLVRHWRSNALCCCTYREGRGHSC